MLPNISPPTDNLYKFIALFGLAIFLFSLYKSGDAFEAVTKSKLEIEDLKLEINRSFAYQSNDSPVLDTASVNVVPVMVMRISADMDSVTTAIEGSGLDALTKEELLTKVRKIQVQNDNLRVKTTEFLITLAFGFLLIIAGFVLWYKKEQVIKDKMLAVELEKAMGGEGNE